MESGVFEKYSNLKLSVEQLQGIFLISDELNISESECLSHWIKCSKRETRRWLESQLNLKVGSLEQRIYLAVKELITYEGDCFMNAGSLSFKIM